LSRHFFCIPLAHDLLILGASTRAAAFSALRCGFRPRCADYFADRDLASVCPVDRIDPRDGARQFSALAESLAPSPWIYTGGLENHPECVEQISRRHALWGVDAGTLRAVRDPVWVADVLAGNAIPCPEARSDPLGLRRDGSWLKKPLASGGGRGIEPLRDHNAFGSTAHFFQERIDGPSFSALFIGDRSQARLIGVTRQWIGIEGSPFGYLGSVGPTPTTPPLASRLESLGNALAFSFGLTGWFGVDFVLRDGIPWPVEINPRYTASLEIHELAAGRSLLPEHRHACEASTPARAAPARRGEHLGRTLLSIDPQFGARISPPSPCGSGERVPDGRVRGLLQGTTKAERPTKVIPANQDQVSTATVPASVDHPPTRVIAKWILHAPRRLVAPEIVPEENERDDLIFVRPITDIPWPGTTFNRGEPVMTLMALGADVAECRSRMIRLEQVWITRLGIVGGERRMGALRSLSWY
jgi:uncharacterized protein